MRVESVRVCICVSLRAFILDCGFEFKQCKHSLCWCIEVPRNAEPFIRTYQSKRPLKTDFNFWLKIV